MIPLSRVRTAEAVHRNFRGFRPRQRLVSLMKAQRKILAGTLAKHDFDSKWGVTKDQLLAETNGKCAYCEAPTSVVAFGDVEHYRPKSVYWWLAYVYDNYLASCALCNQKFKGAHFPLADGRQRLPGPAIDVGTPDDALDALARAAIPDPLDAQAVARYAEDHAQERPLLLNPYLDRPDGIYAWEAIDAIREVRLVPEPGNPEAPAHVAAAIEHYGLDRPELRRLRYKTYEIWKAFRAALDHPDTPQPVRELQASLLASMSAPDSAFAGMIRYFERRLTD